MIYPSTTLLGVRPNQSSFLLYSEHEPFRPALEDFFRSVCIVEKGRLFGIYAIAETHAFYDSKKSQVVARPISRLSPIVQAEKFKPDELERIVTQCTPMDKSSWTVAKENDSASLFRSPAYPDQDIALQYYAVRTPIPGK